jgi:5-methylcytosine-specific restriction enzyme subunit McrC
MNELFQRYITERLKQELRGRLDVVPEPNIYLGKDRQISMNPDLMFRQNGNNVFVGDLKYKLSEDGKGRSSDYYQLLAYLTSTGLQRGVLIYCQNDGQAPLRRTRVVNSGQELLTYPLNMSGTRQQLETSVAELANWICAEVIIP